jgi:hypothetical protein
VSDARRERAAVTYAALNDYFGHDHFEDMAAADQQRCREVAAAIVSEVEDHDFIDQVERALENPESVKRAADMLGMCLLTENDGDAPAEAENRDIWERGTVRAIIREWAGIDVDKPVVPTTVIVLSDQPDGTLNIQLEFNPPYNHHDPESNPYCHTVGGNFIGWLGEQMGVPEGGD